MSASGPATIVIPCFNEEHRLDTVRLAALADTGRLRLLAVDDGSTDGTAEVLAGLSTSGVETIRLARNGGKAEAVRQGLLHAVESGAAVAGYYDADLATPPDELLRLLDVLDSRPDLSFVMASRVMLLGRAIERSPVRHYLGRVFATAASLALELPVYDTQCGAKVFRVTSALVEAVSTPFRSPWAFDIELIGRLLDGEAGVALPPSAFEEVPLREWRDIEGSKIGVREMVRTLGDVILIGAERRRRRRREASR
jgi:dolichyl-phosphate beta-glucosyltransferase